MSKLVIKDEIFLKIQIDVELRKKIAASEGTNHLSVRKACIEKAPKLSQFSILKIIKEHTGWTDEEIFQEVE